MHQVANNARGRVGRREPAAWPAGSSGVALEIGPIERRRANRFGNLAVKELSLSHSRHIFDYVSIWWTGADTYHAQSHSCFGYLLCSSDLIRG